MVNNGIESCTQNWNKLNNKSISVFCIKEKNNGNVFSTHSI